MLSRALWYVKLCINFLFIRVNYHEDKKKMRGISKFGMSIKTKVK
jgi:hypothetical protein